MWFILKLVLNDNWTTKELQENQQKSLELTCLIASIVCMTMSLINELTHSHKMLATTLILSAASFGLFLWTHFNNQSKAPRRICVLIVLVIFSWYFFTGGENGFSAIWILMIPAFFSMLLGFKSGFLCSLYFLVVIITAFWSPLRSNFTSIYTTTFINRFPVIYIGAFLLGTLMQTQLSRYEYIQSNSQLELQRAVEEEHKRVETTTLNAFATISSMVDAKDEYTQQHSKRVAIYATEIARRMGWTEKQIADLHVAALMHDVGKVGIPDTILNKPGFLTDEEYRQIKTHALLGARILKSISTNEYLDGVVRYHHERYDGTGYPEGLHGEEIPIEAQIVCCADAVDAMRSKRVYSDIADMPKIRNEIIVCSEKQFAPKIADTMLLMIDDGFVQHISDDCGEIPNSDMDMQV